MLDEMKCSPIYSYVPTDVHQRGRKTSPEAVQGVSHRDHEIDIPLLSDNSHSDHRDSLASQCRRADNCDRRGPFQVFSRSDECPRRSGIPVQQHSCNRTPREAVLGRHPRLSDRGGRARSRTCENGQNRQGPARQPSFSRFTMIPYNPGIFRNGNGKAPLAGTAIDSPAILSLFPVKIGTLSQA